MSCLRREKTTRSGHGRRGSSKLPAAALPSQLIAPLTDTSPRESLSSTVRQAEVLHWMAEGKTNDEISVILDGSFHTVKNHLRAILIRPEVTSRTGSAPCACRAHLKESASDAPTDTVTPVPPA